MKLKDMDIKTQRNTVNCLIGRERFCKLMLVECAINE